MQDDSQDPRFIDGVHLGRKTVAPAEMTAEGALQLLETRLPRIAKEVRARWGSENFDPYLDALLIDDRGDRAGFPTDIAQALLTLSREHHQRFPRDPARDPWFWPDPTLNRERA